MGGHATDKVFSGAIAQLYASHLVPVIFEPYALDLAARIASRPVRRVLEVAAGTGVVTRAMLSVLPDQVSIVATDLNQAMLDEAAATGTKRPVEWRQADAMSLPFDPPTRRASWLVPRTVTTSAVGSNATWRRGASLDHRNS